MSKNPLRDEMREASAVARGASWRIYIAIIAAIVAVGAISVGIWYFKVATSDAKGAGDATREINSVANRLQAQAEYTRLYNGILAADRNLDVLAAAVDRDPTQINQTNLVGAQNICQTAVGDYNALATNALKAKWRPVELPQQVGFDPATDCQPTITATPTR
jgi:hypothetical protein